MSEPRVSHGSFTIYILTLKFGLLYILYHEQCAVLEVKANDAIQHKSNVTGKL